MTNETTRITAKANETMAHSNREHLKVAQKVAAGEMSKAEALGILDELEKADTALIADIDRRIKKLEGELEGLEKGSEGLKDNRIYWLLLIPIILLGSLAVWVLVSSLRGG